MKPELLERAEQLKIRNAKKQLNAFGRLLVDGRECTLWDLDTAVLPRAARKWRKRARRFAREEIRPLAAQADLDPHGYDPAPLLTAASKKGFQTLLLVRPFGSAGITTFLKSTTIQLAVVAEEFATECGGLGLLLLGHNLGIAPLLLAGHVGTYLRHFLPIYLKATWLGKSTVLSFAITEPAAGSDVESCDGAVQAKVTVTARPEKGGYVLNGTKVFITDGAVADKIVVYACLEGEKIDSWTCFLVDTSMSGVIVGRHERKMGQRASDASEIILEDVFVPRRNIIGKLRSGWANNHNVLNFSRPVVAAMALGHGRGAFERALKFCRDTTLAGKRLVDYPDVQYELADMAISLWAARSMVWRCCASFRANQALSSTAKVFASDTAVRVCNQAMELMGDAGYLHRFGVERAWRDSRLTQIYEGTNQINRYDVIEHQWDYDFSKDCSEKGL
ncbi:MAG: acyl-CoA dehydrogenase family protein [Myxococcota bacterium]|nr:acyl-CoA dehydrogenase family protein [Myxococcota bacterium]